ncbi:sulfotransferase family protein [Rhodovulum sulfidophilum]|uniref:Sulfotransferase n=3 Tax=Rhodovulum sulfidophilum TaxID=35806 RepID=A0ABS1RWR0_RHOSU|nr:sulfotransferase [Rhodovulum sulfidophilum]MBL3610317.1 sulfotransferase [Rhodovulum sulfidophilum]
MRGITLKQPVFVVGHPRSGTTLLATVLGRHSLLAMPPETQYLIEQAPLDGHRLGAEDLDAILANPRIADLGLDRDAVQAAFGATDRSFGAAFAVLLDIYRRQCGKPRAGEKSPMHLVHAERLLEWFPDARILCIERNGADVIASLMRMPWSHRIIRRHGYDWLQSLRRGRALEARHPAQAMRVRYERLTAAPEAEIRRICAFCGLPFEPSMLSPGAAGTVPDWERGWKADAARPIAPARGGGAAGLGRWQRAELAAICNRELRAAGYPPVAAPTLLRLLARLTVWPYHPALRPVFARIRAFVRRRTARWTS